MLDGNPDSVNDARRETGTNVPIRPQPAVAEAPTAPNRHERAATEAGTPDVISPDIASELTIRAGIDPAWDAVLRAYLDGVADYPVPFTARRPR